MPSALVMRWRMCSFQTFVIICKGCSLNMCCLPRFIVKNPSWGWVWGQGFCDRSCDPEQQFCSCFSITGTGDGKIPTAEVGQRRGKITLQTKIWRKIFTKDCNQDDGRVWVSFVCFFSKIVQGQSWYVFKCHICSVIWQTCLFLLPPNYITWWDGGSFTCFATAWWVIWQDEEHNMIIRVSCLSFFIPPPAKTFSCLWVGAVLAVLGSDTLFLSRHHAHVVTARADPMCAATLHASLILTGQQPHSHMEKQPLRLKKHIRPAQVFGLCYYSFLPRLAKL